MPTPFVVGLVTILEELTGVIHMKMVIHSVILVTLWARRVTIIVNNVSTQAATSEKSRHIATEKASTRHVASSTSMLLKQY